MSVADDIARLKNIRETPGYMDRVRAQMFSWANGKPYHDPINDECCPDFSCCFPSLFEPDQAKRWEAYRNWVAEHETL